MNQTRTIQGGSVVNFLIVGIVLAGITLAGIHFVQQRSDDSPVTVSPSPVPSTSMPAGQSTNPSASSPSPSASPRATSVPTPAPGTVPASNLPTTGPADDLVMSAVPLALLVGAMISYLKSRHSSRAY